MSGIRVLAVIRALPRESAPGTFAGAGGLIRALLAALIGMLGAALIAAPAAAEQVFLELRPSTIQAGYQLELRANCGDKVNPATVHSTAFGEVVLHPKQNQQQDQHQPGPSGHHDQVLLTATVTVPTSTAPGEYAVELRCADGTRASATLFVLDMARPTRGPDTGGGGAAAANEPRDGRPTDGGAFGWLAVIAGAGGAAAVGLGTVALLSLRGPRTHRRP